MRHFDIIEWTDYVRGLAEESDRQEMSAHLESGCASCTRTVDLLQSVVEVARVESELSPPVYAVRAVKNSFRISSPDKQSWLEPIKLALHFDSALVPAPVGELRWRAPRTAERWTQTRPALAFGPRCPQLASALEGAKNAGELIGEEDIITAMSEEATR